MNPRKLAIQSGRASIPLVAAIAALAATLSACANLSTTYVASNDVTRRCDYMGFGFLGAANARSAHDVCSTTLRAAGYLRVEDVGYTGLEALEPVDGGVRIERLSRTSPAASGGLAVGDVVTRVDGQWVRYPRDARSLLFGPIGAPVAVLFKHEGGEDREVVLRRVPADQVVLTDAAADAAAPAPAKGSPGADEKK